MLLASVSQLSRSLECEAHARCQLRTMRYPGLELENIRRDPVGIVGGSSDGC